jgi:DNA-binding transcriptional MerR regulator
MANKIAKLLLEQADTFLERTKAIETALYLGMPLHEIEEYLDWLDTVRPPRDKELPDRGPVSDTRRRPKAG